MEEVVPALNPEQEITQIESLCTVCHNQGLTKLLLCRIPYFKDIVLMSFQCDTCNWRNNQVQSVASLQEFGYRASLTVNSVSDLNRSVIKSEYCTVAVPFLGLQIPPATQKGVFSTVEGIISKIRDDLSMLQPQRHQADPVTAQKIDQFIGQINHLLSGEVQFEFILDDPSGNSFISHDPYKDPLQKDSNLETRQYQRTRQQMVAMGYINDQQEKQETKLVQEMQDMAVSAHNIDFSQGLREDIFHDQPAEIPTECFACLREGRMKICVTNIPHFKETVVMAFNCDFCGAKSNQIKGGGQISSLGRRLILAVDSANDMDRSVIKSDTALVEIPELELQLSEGTLGSLVTTVEGLVKKIHEKLANSLNFTLGDSNNEEENLRISGFLQRLEEFGQGRHRFTLVVDDPLSNSYIGPALENQELRLVVQDYQRSPEQDLELGITDMNTNSYQNSKWCGFMDEK